MMTATVDANRPIDLSAMFKSGEQVVVMNKAELDKKLERERNNAVYLAELKECIKQSQEGRVVRHELIEDYDVSALD